MNEGAKGFLTSLKKHNTERGGEEIFVFWIFLLYLVFVTWDGDGILVFTFFLATLLSGAWTQRQFLN